MALVGCPDRRIDRLCITCCSPSQPSHHAGCPARSRLCRKRDGLFVTLALGHHGPGHARNLAKSLGAKVSVIFVVEPFSEMTGRFQEAVRAANAAKEVGISCKTAQVENGQPHQAIIAAAEDKGCDLIVMSSHGRSGLSMLLIGSVTNKVLTHAKTPVTGLSVTVQTAR